MNNLFSICFLFFPRFLLVNVAIVYIYYNSFQKVDEEEYGGTAEILKEGLMTSFSSFLVILIKKCFFLNRIMLCVFGENGICSPSSLLAFKIDGHAKLFPLPQGQRLMSFLGNPTVCSVSSPHMARSSAKAPYECCTLEGIVL
jgi:hypothetical protein